MNLQLPHQEFDDSDAACSTSPAVSLTAPLAVMIWSSEIFQKNYDVIIKLKKKLQESHQFSSLPLEKCRLLPSYRTNGRLCRRYLSLNLKFYD